MGTKNIYGEVRINDEIVATQDWVAANAGGGGGGTQLYLHTLSFDSVSNKVYIVNRYPNPMGRKELQQAQEGEYDIEKTPISWRYGSYDIIYMTIPPIGLGGCSAYYFDDVVATSVYLGELVEDTVTPLGGSGSSSGGEKEVIITNVLEMYENQDVDKFLELSNRAIIGDCIIIALYAGMTAIVDSCVQYSEGTFEWRGTIFNHSGSADGVFVSPMVTAFQLASHAGELLELVIEEFPLGGVDKAYVEDNFVPKIEPALNNGSGVERFWVNNGISGSWRYVQGSAYTAAPWYIASYMEKSEGDSAVSGYMLTNTPERPYQAANKKYVDEKNVNVTELCAQGAGETNDSYFVLEFANDGGKWAFVDLQGDSDLSVDWGDGTNEVLGSNGIMNTAAIHLYEKKGTYVVTIHGLTTIGSSSFSQERAPLKSVILGKKVHTIGPSAFYRCANLESYVGKYVTRYNQQCFQECGALKTIDLGINGPVAFGHHSFSKCNSLTSIIVPDSIEHTAGGSHFAAFGECDNLKEITLLSKNGFILRYFSNNSQLEKIWVADKEAYEFYYNQLTTQDTDFVSNAQVAEKLDYRIPNSELDSIKAELSNGIAALSKFAIKGGRLEPDKTLWIGPDEIVLFTKNSGDLTLHVTTRTGAETKSIGDNACLIAMAGTDFIDIGARHRVFCSILSATGSVIGGITFGGTTEYLCASQEVAISNSASANGVPFMIISTSKSSATII